MIGGACFPLQGSRRSTHKIFEVRAVPKPAKDKRCAAMNSNPEPKMEHPFLSDIHAIRQRVRQHKGAVTQSDQGEPQLTVRILNEALATERVCVLRYKRHYHMTKGIYSQAVSQEFLEHVEAVSSEASRR